MDIEEFFKTFVEYMTAEDDEGMQRIVREQRLAAFETAIVHAAEGISLRVSGQAEYMSYDVFDASETIAWVWAVVFNKFGLPDLIASYRAYSKTMCIDKIRAEHLYEDGLYLFDKNNKKRQ